MTNPVVGFRGEMTLAQMGFLLGGVVLIDFLGSVSEGTDFGQKKNLKPWVYWFMV